MIVTRTLAGLALLLACGYGAFAAVVPTWAVVDVMADPDEPDGWWALPLVLAGALAVAGVVRAGPPLWRTARTGEDRALAHRRFWLAWLAVLPLGALLFWVALAQVLYTAMALPVAALALLAEHYVQSRHDHSGLRARRHPR